MKLNCLITNTSAINDIKDGMIILANDYIQLGQDVSFPRMFDEIKKQGLEIDAESAGYIYLQAFGDSNSKKFSSYDEVEKYSLAQIQSNVNSIVSNIRGEEKDAKEKTMGILSEEKRIAKSFASLFDKKYFKGLSQDTESMMVQMGKLVEKALKQSLPKEKSQNVTSVNEALSKFFEAEEFKVDRLDGGVNTIESLWKASKKEIDNYLSEITKNLSVAEADLVRDLWGGYMEKVNDAMYDIMLNTSSQEKLLKQALQKIKVGDKNIVDKNGTILWSVLSEDLDVDEVVSNLTKLFKDGFTDSTGKEVKYTEKQSERLAEYLGRVLERKVSEYTIKQIANERAARLTAKNLISDFLKEKGAFSLRKDEKGELSKSVSNWSDFLNDITKKGLANKKMTIDELKKNFVDYLNGLQNEDGSKTFTDQNKINELADSFEKAIEDKLVPDTLTPNSIDKFVAASKLNGSNAFNETSQQLLNKLVGVSGLDQATLNKLNRLANLISTISGADIEGTPKTRGEFAFQAYSQIDRLIKEILSDYKQDKSATQKLVKTISGMMGATTGSLLLNPKNFIENITTGIGTTMVEMLRLAISNPKMFSKLMKQGGSEFMSAWASHASGGAHGNIFAEQDLSVDIAQGERLRPSSFSKMKWNSPSSVLKNIGNSYSIAVNTFMRAFMNSFDAGFNEVIGKLQMYDTTYEALKESFGVDEADRIMSEALEITPEIKKEIKDESLVIVDAMKLNGLNPTPADRRLIEKQMRTSLYREAMQNSFGANSAQRSMEATKALFQASQLATKELLGKRKTSSKDYVSNLAYYLTTMGMIDLQQHIFNQVKRKESEGNLKGAAIEELLAETMRSGPNKFVGGMANFLILAMGATPLGAFQVASYKSQIKQLEKENKEVGNLNLSLDSDKLIKYYHLKQMYKAVMARAIMGTALSAMVAMYLLKGSGDDDEYTWVENLLSTKSGRRLLTKETTLGMAIAAIISSRNTETDFDEMSERIGLLTETMGGNKASIVSKLMRDLKNSKSEEDDQKAIGDALKNLTVQGNLNQGEQITQFANTLESAFSGDTQNVLQDEATSKQIYKEMEGFVDGFMGNGMINSLQRIYSNEPYNRYSQD